MRNYKFGSDLRHVDDDEHEPELQWLEDSINYLAALSFALICVIAKLCVQIIYGVFQTFKKRDVTD